MVDEAALATDLGRMHVASRADGRNVVGAAELAASWLLSGPREAGAHRNLTCREGGVRWSLIRGWHGAGRSEHGDESNENVHDY